MNILLNYTKMKKLQLTNNLWLHEYIDKETYLAYEKANKLYKLAYKIDADLLRSDQMLRDYFGRVVINNWYDGGTRQWGGLRLPKSQYYSKDSLHTEFKASDKIFNHSTNDVIREYIRENWKELRISAIELGVGWIHSDTRYIPFQTKLFEFNK